MFAILLEHRFGGSGQIGFEKTHVFPHPIVVAKTLPNRLCQCKQAFHHRRNLCGDVASFTDIALQIDEDWGIEFDTIGRGDMTPVTVDVDERIVAARGPVRITPPAPPPIPSTAPPSAPKRPQAPTPKANS